MAQQRIDNIQPLNQPNPLFFLYTSLDKQRFVVLSGHLKCQLGVGLPTDLKCSGRPLLFS